jgi:cytoskeletal protein CcmA (bactofilin family)
VDENAQQTEDNPTTVIGPDIKIVGNLEASGDLKIEGNVEGDVWCRRLIVGEGGTISGRVFSEQARISGQINGSIEAEGLAIEATGAVTGEATYGRLKVTTGGVIDGKIKRKREGEKKPKQVDTGPVGDEQGGARSQAPKRRPGGLFGGTAPTKTSN